MNGLLELNILYKCIFEEILKGLEDEDYEYLKEIITLIVSALDSGIKLMGDLDDKM